MPMPQSADTLFSGELVQDTVITAADLDPAEAAADTAIVSMGEATDQALGTVESFINTFYAALPRLAVALVVFAVFWGIAKLLRNVVRRLAPGPDTGSVALVLGRLTYAGILLGGLLVSLVVLIPSFKFGELIGALGIGGVAIGFAFQDIFQNLLAGILILLRQPFRVGDEITSGEYTGTVEAIETRATFIRTYDGRRVIVPNAKIYSDPVTVITAYNMVRAQYDVGIGYGDDVEEAKQIALDALKSVEGVLQDPAPDVLTWDLAASWVTLRIRWWTDPKRASVVRMHDAVLRRVYRDLEAAGIDLPFQTQVMLFHDQTDAFDGDRALQREGWPVDGEHPAQARIVDGLRSRKE